MALDPAPLALDKTINLGGRQPLRRTDDHSVSGDLNVIDDGRQYYPDTANKQLKKFLKKHKLAPVGLHELRHTYCTFLIASGADIKTVQAAMGHNDSRMTVELYAHIVDEKKKAISGAVDGYLKAS